MATVLVVDDTETGRRGLTTAIEASGHRVEAVAGAAAALERLSHGGADLVVLSLSLPDDAAWRLLAALKGDPPVAGGELPVLTVGDHGPDHALRSGIEGAVAHLGLPLDGAAVATAVFGVLAGGPELAQRRAAQRAALAEIARSESGHGAADVAVVHPRLTRLEHQRRPDVPVLRVARDRLHTLTPGQRAILTQLAESPSATEAAARLGVSRSNVYASLRRIVRKLDVASVDDVRALVREHGLLEEP